MTATQVKRTIQSLADPKRDKLSSRYFKTGPGQYGEGDVFAGLKAAQTKAIIRQHREMPLTEVKKLINDKIHECRSVALGILVWQFTKGGERQKKTIYDFYFKNVKGINNWDLIDGSAPKIVGPYLLDKNRAFLYQLAQSKNVWQRRIAIMATAAFIRENQLADTLKLAKILLQDPHDLIHKAVGWMLREVGKKDEKTLTAFLEKRTLAMPRTMLRYAIEKFPERKRQYFLKKR